MNTCLCCKKAFKPHTDSFGLYCSNKCQNDQKYIDYITRWLVGLETGNTGKNLQLSNHVRRYMRLTRGTACEECGWDEKHPVDGRALTEIDHTDGDASNTTPVNLKVLCPNHHAMTPTFRARNKNSKRKR